MRNKLFFLYLLFCLGTVCAQGTQTSAIKVSSQIQTINNKQYYIHIVEQGQTVFSIARAYGLKYYDAVLKTDIHQMKVGDTVWLPTNDYSVAAVSAAAKAQLDKTINSRYIRVNAGQTLYGIAREYGTTMEAIIEENPELRTEQLKAGQMLKLPSQASTSQPAQKDTTVLPHISSSSSNKDTIFPTNLNLENETSIPNNQSIQSQHAQSSQTQSQPVGNTLLKETNKPVQVSVSHPGKPILSNVKTLSSSNESFDDLEFDPYAKLNLRHHSVENPYPFNEATSDFPSTQAPYFNFSTPSSFGFQVRDRQSKSKIFVTLVMPLNLNKIDQISTSKFDIEQRGKKDYKIFEFVQFYEGILIALDQLSERGYNVVLNVVDLVSEQDADVEKAWNDYKMANSDFIIALLVKKPFDKLASLANEHQVFVINPFSIRSDVVVNRPYVVKYMPSVEGIVNGILNKVSTHYPNSTLYLIHSGNKSASSNEKEYFEEFQKQLTQRNDLKYVLFDWSANAKLIPSLKSSDNNVIVSIYNQDKNKNTIFATTLLNRLSSLNTNVPTLITTTNWLTDFPSADFEQLQHLNYASVVYGYLDYNNPLHKQFVDTYKSKFKTEPNPLYAAVGHDIVCFFVTALSQKGPEFWRNPQLFSSPNFLLYPLRLKQSSPSDGYENMLPDMYQMRSFHLIKF